MASGYPGAVSAAQVGSYFVNRYYQVLQQQPDFAHQFYTDASTMIQIDGDFSESASAMLKIHTLVMSLKFTEIEIKTINCLESWNGGVLVVVSGTVKAKDFSRKRKFVQTFLLAPQDKGYFVLNDIFHFMDEDVVLQHIVPLLSENKIHPQQPNSAHFVEPKVPDYGLEEEATEFVNSVHIDENDAVDNYSVEYQHHYSVEDHLQQQQQQDFESEAELEDIPAEDFSAALLHNVVESEPEPVHCIEEPVAEPPKLTYASILRAPKGQSVPAVASQPSFTKSTPPASEWDYPQPPALQVNVQESRLETADENPSLDEEGELKSVYVRNLPSTVSAADIEQEFKIFGRITPDGVFIRNRKDIGVCYAFVEFEDFQAVQNAVKASPIQLAGKMVYIEERRANNSGVASRGRGGRGRGNYQSDPLRGRFSGRNSGRGNLDGGDSIKPRGNGFR